jgi:hypothetical protein
MLLCHSVHGYYIAKKVLGGGQTILSHTGMIPGYSGIAMHNPRSR